MRHLVDVAPEGGDPYPVFVGTDAAAALASWWRPRWRQAVVIGDATTSALFAAPIVEALERRGVEVQSLSFPAGERHKTRATKERLEDAMLAAAIERDACVIGLGGGVPLDLAGFVAATYLRGVDHVFVATTLLAQLDAAIGGKVGVDTPHGKNLIGAFHQPRAVFCDRGALELLPEDERRNGLAEMVKHAAISDASLFADLEGWNGSRALPDEALLARSIAIKAEVVSRDTRDRGVRQILNFGHTVGHALEAATSHALPHGRAVAIGMTIEARLAARAGWLPSSHHLRLESLLARLGLPTTAPVSFDRAAPFFAADKKTVDGVLTCALPERLGDVPARDGRFTRPVTLTALAEAWS